VWLLVILTLSVALLRGLRAPAGPLDVNPIGERHRTRIVSGAVAVTTLVMIGLTLLSYFSDRTLAAIGANPTVKIRVTGHQWWWEVRYQSDQPNRIVTTANEIHIPVGEPVELTLTSTDVIHSFWVPSLAGKLDLIPGRENVLGLNADKAGVYRGQCAEFCGAQHAHMGVLIKAEARPAFDAWLGKQLEPAAEATSDEAATGRQLVLTRPCVMCHQIRGTIAGATAGPDLTHLASRQTLAAGTLSMSRGNLAAWIADPQGIKPGAHMPVMNLNGDELNAIVAYLESLK